MIAAIVLIAVVGAHVALQTRSVAVGKIITVAIAAAAVIVRAKCVRSVTARNTSAERLICEITKATTLT